MEPIQIAVIAALIAFIAGLLLFLTKSVLAPKRAENILKLIKQKKLSAAEKLAKQILAKEPKNYLVHYYLGKAYLAENRAELALMEYKTVSEKSQSGDEPLPLQAPEAGHGAPGHEGFPSGGLF